MDVQITQVDPLTGEVSLSLGLTPKKLRGINKLVQKVAIKVLKNFGRDVFYPDEGTDFRNEIGQLNISASGGEDELRLIATQRIRKIEAEIIDQQGPEIGDPTERLKKINILDIAADISQASAAIRMQVINEAGEQKDVIV
jgi:hypothetical protein